MPIKRSLISDSLFENPDQRLKEHQRLDTVKMFTKPLTPSDVGKLNRLVIPKQHAEKHFPMARSDGSVELLLSFEDGDAAGRWWRFRYSYWASSQSYVITKGWSRYVKEKGLQAGDVIAFERHRENSGHWFIGWRRRQLSNISCGTPKTLGKMAAAAEDRVFSGGTTAVINFGCPYDTHRRISSLPFRSCQPFVDRVGTSRGSVDLVRKNRTTRAGSLRMLRFFGVNLECEL